MSKLRSVMRVRIGEKRCVAWIARMREDMPPGTVVTVQPDPSERDTRGQWWITLDAPEQPAGGWCIRADDFEVLESWVEFDTKATHVDVQYRFEQELPDHEP